MSRGDAITSDGAVLIGVVWQAISAGSYHACGITTTGEALCWGNNYAGETIVPEGHKLWAVSAGRMLGGCYNSSGLGQGTRC